MKTVIITNKNKEILAKYEADFIPLKGDNIAIGENLYVVVERLIAFNDETPSNNQNIILIVQFD